MTPRILYITPHRPDRATGASEIRSRSIARALAGIGRIECIVVHDPDDAASMPADRPVPVPVRDTFLVTRHPNSTLRSKLRWLADPRLEYPHGCGVARRDMRCVVRTARQFDLTWFFKLRTANMFPRWKWERSVVDIDDVPSAYEHSLLNTADSAVERLSARLRAMSWQRRERLLGDRFSALAVCSMLDRKYLELLGITKPVHVVPNGVDLPATAPMRQRSTPPRIGFIGLFDYEPNLLGVQWFARECWPRIKASVPDARLRLAGRGSDGWLALHEPDIDGLGFVRDADAEMASWSAMVVPIQVGAGTRGKLAHAFSVKCPVVSTRLGAYGYDVSDGEHVLLADLPSDFADACIKAIVQPAEADAMAERAWHQCLAKWTWDAIQPRIRSVVEDCLRLDHQVPQYA